MYGHDMTLQLYKIVIFSCEYIATCIIIVLLAVLP